MNLLIVGILFFAVAMILFGGKIYEYFQTSDFRTKRKAKEQA